MKPEVAANEGRVLMAQNRYYGDGERGYSAGALEMTLMSRLQLIYQHERLVTMSKDDSQIG
jgi:hypothetical protein